MAEDEDAQARIEVDLDDSTTLVILRGDFTVQNVSRLHSVLSQVPEHRNARIDLHGVGRLDTSGAWALARLRRRLERAGQTLEMVHAGAAVPALLDRVAVALPGPDEAPTRRRGLGDRLEALGRMTVASALYLVELTAYLGLFVARLGRSILHPRAFRLTALVHHCQEVGQKAVPIVAVMAFLIGVVLAFQGAAQLRQFGAEIFVVDLIAVSILRELGILLTAIIVAGRTASAFTAAIGSMKMREEIDAMRTLGLDPAMTLFVPRILALVLMLPILGLVANIAGLIGGALMSWLELGISPALFAARLAEGTSVTHAVVGLSKAPVFALIIGVIGCHAGMKVERDSESLGRMTSSAVVAAIFAVIAADALFSIFFAGVGM